MKSLITNSLARILHIGYPASDNDDTFGEADRQVCNFPIFLRIFIRYTVLWSRNGDRQQVRRELGHQLCLVSETVNWAPTMPCEDRDGDSSRTVLNGKLVVVVLLSVARRRVPARNWFFHIELDFKRLDSTWRCLLQTCVFRKV